MGKKIDILYFFIFSVERNMKLPVIDGHPCIDCLVDTERVLRGGFLKKPCKGNNFWYRTWGYETESLRSAVGKCNPRNVLEIGCGTGRVIAMVLESDPEVKITGLENNREMYDFVHQRFSREERVEIVNCDVSDYLSNGGQYDVALCMMNTLANINSSDVFRKILTHSDRFVFSVYNSDFDSDRELMYRARGHRDFSFVDGTYRFRDSWVDGLTSRSYSAKDVRDLVVGAGGDIVEFGKAGILHFVVATLASRGK